MPVRIVQLGSERLRGEGLRIGTVRRPPRGVRKSDRAKLNWFDVWLPNLAPSTALLNTAKVMPDGRGWPRFEKRYRAELKKPEPSHVLDLLARLSHRTNFSVGCYCPDEGRCHRRVLRQVLQERGCTVK